MVLHIDIFIPFYTYHTDNHRYRWTRVIFKHMANIAGQLQDEAHFTFTLLGSEGERSRILATEFMDARNYAEFNQDAPEYEDKFWNMFLEKVRKGMSIAASKNPDIILWMGSNDYIPIKFFEDIIDFYNNNNGENQGQMYGIDNYKNGKNAVFFSMYDGEKHAIDIHNEAFWWEGRYHPPRNIFHYSAGIIGLNKAAYKEHPDIIQNWHWDEGVDEEMMIKKGNIQKFCSNRCFYLNIKMKSGKELNDFAKLRNEFNEFILRFQDFDLRFQKYVNSEVTKLIDLMKTIN